MRPTLITLFYLLFFFPINAAEPDWTSFAGKEKLNAPTIEKLADQLTADLNSDLDKAAVFYYWITHNVAYDMKVSNKALKKENSRQLYTADQVEKMKEAQVQLAFQKKRGICQNYARLFRRMAEAVGLEAEFVTGHSRANAMRPGSLGNGHAWNAVKIDGKWGLVDATWGAGSIDDKGRFQQKFRPEYFLPTAASLAYSHLPDQDDWQLLGTPISKKEFLNQPATGPDFLHYGISALSHPKARIELSRGKGFELVFKSDVPLKQLSCANLTASKGVPCAVTEAGSQYTLTIPAEHVRNMMFGLFEGEGGLLVSYRLVVR